MQTSLTESGDRVDARYVNKGSGPFKCPACNRQTFVKKGTQVRHHFAHERDSDCAYGYGETAEHLEAKQEIYDALLRHPLCKDTELEPYKRGCWTDIYTNIGGLKVAIEVQRSRMSFEDISARTRRFNKHGMYTLWIVTEIPWDGEYYKPHKWQRDLHGMCFGKLYLWSEKARVVPLHLKPASRVIPWREWFDEYGEYHEAGGHTQAYKTRFHIVYPNGEPEDVHIATLDKNRNTKQEILLWTDRFGKWWR